MGQSGFSTNTTRSEQLLFLTDDQLRQGIELMFFAYRGFTADPDRILAERQYGRAHHRAIHFINRRPGLTVNELAYPTVPEGRLLLQTLRSHDQFNTTIYGLDDRYRGVEGGRRVVFVHREDIAALGFEPGDMVDLVSHWADDDALRCAPSFRIVEYDTPRGSAAAYYPETNPLVPLDSTAVGSNTPVYKSVVVSLVPEGTGTADKDRQSQDERGSDSGHKARPEPAQLS